MTLGVFGDSYSIGGWVNSLNKQLTNYSVGGSSFDYSYLQFRKHHTRFDEIVFVVTSTTRGSVFTIENNNPKHLAFYQNIDLDELRKLNLNIQSRIDSRLSKIISNDIKKNTWYNSNIVYHLSYLDSILYQRPDAHIVFAFDFPTINKGCMNNISMLDCNELGVPEYMDNRTCHMSDKQNEEFANYMIRHMNNKDFDVHQTLLDPKEYYTVSKSRKEAGWI